MGLQILEIHKFQRGDVGRMQDHGWRDAGLERFTPPQNTQAPSVARLQARKLILRNRGDQIVPATLGECEKLVGHLGAYQMKS